ncbi:ubiquitin-conjugating enzyme E2 S [Aspergillus lentulus]|uniref:Ubiquitin-conjugating enzyme E2 S n=1 Tax=Aspergillus lentulus TaxID=293939 RepID=A0ABQ0ZW59_ASPLE|nr:ubiquitin-conjugating enzyme E2 S [Aspergillus lentulus]GFF27067.1 ubiquitin-conjugating enzyme E2 S [Aspergillus lentulus]GFF46896.1 ubiquitin-conjugating enzyme E2 S [Aspergillus lentulus]GFF66720.1 ubiquitin-conjugating enzyme E2 S [Aspergillus lentulus]GFG14944.1 ubiquitin-conjugating enzyme E2 S [Aspergillus lentulus]
MRSSFRRLAADHAALHEELPPNYLFPTEDSSDDLTQLTTLLAGPQGTPYSQGLWRLHLKMPEDYPKSPPKATFKTRIWHPNVEESTGAVCVDTLKRDWKSTLTLKDVLVTISCLLIYPNPDSALNSTAGALLQEDYDAFARQAKLMTSIHAPVPPDLKTAVVEAKSRGEEAGTLIPEHEGTRSLRSRTGTRVQSLTMKTKKPSVTPQPSDQTDADPHNNHPESDDDSDTTRPSTSKENDPSLSPCPVKLALPSPRKNAHGKRPLSDLTTSLDPEPDSLMEPDFAPSRTTDKPTMTMTTSEKNIAANHTPHRDSSPQPQPQRKSPKLSHLDKGVNASARIRDDVIIIFEDASDPSDVQSHHSNDSKENRAALHASKGMGPSARKSPHYPSSLLAPSPAITCPSGSKSRAVSGSRKVSSSSMKAKPRIGIRRL